MTYSLLQYIDNTPKLDKKQREKLDKISKERAKVDRKKVAVEVLLDGWQKCTFLIPRAIANNPTKLDKFKRDKIKEYQQNEAKAHNMWNKKIE